MKLLLSFSLILCAFFNQSSLAKDAFDAVQCGGDIPKALIGKRIKNERLVVIEARHKNMGLKGLGTYEISENLLSTYWMICGNEFVLLEDKKFLIHDVLQIPDHSKNSLPFIGNCAINNQVKPDTIFAILNNEVGVKALSASAAWVINKKKKVFEKISIDGIQCQRDDIQ